jgi:hypothetical protein
MTFLKNFETPIRALQDHIHSIVESRSYRISPVRPAEVGWSAAHPAVAALRLVIARPSCCGVATSHFLALRLSLSEIRFGHTDGEDRR